jgi:hypothetical protein
MSQKLQLDLFEVDALEASTGFDGDSLRRVIRRTRRMASSREALFDSDERRKFFADKNGRKVAVDYRRNNR